MKMKIDRLIAIIMILLQRERVSANELADMFEVSPRTIYRDLDSINQAGIPVLATSGPGGGAEILKTYKVDKHLFSTSDITALLMGLGSIQSNFPGHEVKHALAKVKGMFSPELHQETAFRAGQIKIDALPWLHAEACSETMSVIKMALEQQRLLEFDYRDIRNRKSRRTIEPYRILLKGEDWYVQGYCLIRNDFRTFKLLRIEQISVLEQTFKPRQFPADQLDQIQFNDDRLTAVKLRIHVEIKDLITARFGSGCLTPDGSQHYIANVHMPVDELASRYLMSFGNKCVCLEPPNMRQTMCRLAAEIFSFYHSGD